MSFRKVILGIMLAAIACASAHAYEFKLLSEIPLKGKASAVSVNMAADTTVVISEAKLLTIIDNVSGAVIRDVPLPVAPSGVAIHRGWNKAIVAALSGIIYVIDLKNGETEKTIDAGAPVYAVAIDELKNCALLGIDGGLEVVDLATGELLPAVRLAGKTERLCVGKTSAVVAIREESGTRLRRLDTATGSVKAETPHLAGGVASLGLDEQLGLVLVTMSDKPGLLLFDLNTLRQCGEIQTARQAGIISVNPSTHIAVLADTLDGSLPIVDLEKQALIETIPLFEGIASVSVDPARNRALVAHGESLALVQLENPLPTISDLVPKEGASGEKELSLSITGAKFVKESRAGFNGEDTATQFEGNEQLKASIPPDKLLSPGNVPVTVTTPPPGGGTSNELFFKVLTPAPQLSGLSPAAVLKGSPTFTLKVEGKNFLPTATVNFNGKKIEGGFVSSTLLKVPIDASALQLNGNYPVTVTNKGPTSFTSNAAYLKVVTAEEAAVLGAGSMAVMGTGSLGGRILNTDMQPINGATIRYNTISARTDQFGNFTLNSLPAGKRTILIDGSTAEEIGSHYPVIPITAEITAGVHNPMPFTPYLHRQKNYNFVNIDQGSDTILTDPEVPGFEMRIPRGVNITGWDGKTNLRVSVRTVPVNRLPVRPVPADSNIRTVYMFYFDKVGGGKPDRPIPIKAPNDLGLLPGEKAILWYYDESPIEGEAPNDWAIAGTGTVSADGRFIETDPGVGIPKFCCGATAWGGTGASLPTSCKEGCGGTAGDPVDVTTGYFLHEQTDLTLPGIIPVEIRHVYRSRDSGSAVSGSTGLGAFGKGMYFAYDWWLGTYNSMLRLTKPGSYQYDFALQGDGSYQNSTDPEFRGAKVTVNVDSTKTLRMRDGRTYKFNTYGELIEIADRNGNKVAIARVHGSPDEGGHISTITTAEGRVITFNSTYTGNFHRNDSIVLPDGRTIRYVYETDLFNSYPRLKQVKYPDGSSIQYGYDSQGRMNTVTNRRGVGEVTNIYDTSHRVTSQTHPDGGTYIFDYSIAGQTAMTAPNGAQTTWSYNGYSYLTQKITPDGTTTYNKATGTNELLSVTDPLNRTTSYTYYSTADARNGLLHTMTDPLLNVTTYDYEANYGLPISITDPLGKITAITYTPNPLTTPPTQAVIKDPLLNTTTINYNTYGMPTSITDPNSNTTTLTYDPNNHGQLTSITDPSGNSVNYAYDAIGRLASLTDSNGAKTTYGYDLIDRVNSVTDPLDGTTRYHYDENGKLTMVFDARNNWIRFEYDDRNRITKMTDQLDRYETYTYYRNAEITPTTGDNLKSYTDRKGQTTNFNEYDPQNRLKRVTFHDGSYIQNTYDAVGRAINIYDSLTGAIARTYNDYGCGTCTGRGLDLISQEVTTLGTIDYTYDKNGRRVTMTVAGEPVVNFTWDDAGRMSKLSRSINGTVKDFTFGYDAGSRRTSFPVPLYKSQGKWKYLKSTSGYDIANHLTSLLHQNPTTNVESLTYAYDANGNRKSFSRIAAQTLSPAVTSTTHDAANEMLALNAKSFAYDANGNLQTRTDACGTTTYAWDARNRLTGISGYKPDCTTLTASFTYDALNRRISKTINSTTTQFVYDRWDIIQEIKAGIKTNYVRTLNIDEPLVRTSSTATRYYLLDALGSALTLTDGNGIAKTTYIHDAFGNVTTSGEASDNPFQFTSRENDGTGLLHYRFRYYSPEMQRFISEDPIRLMGGTNYYTMTGNNPVNWIDPFGLRPGDWWDPSGYISLSFSSTDSSGRGTVLSSGIEQNTYTLGSLGGASLDLQLGTIPKPCEKTKEIAVGPLGKYFGIGYFWSTNSNRGGIAFHFGLGFSSPVTYTTTSPTNTALPPTFPSDLEWRQGR